MTIVPNRASYSHPVPVQTGTEDTRPLYVTFHGPDRNIKRYKVNVPSGMDMEELKRSLQGMLQEKNTVTPQEAIDILRRLKNKVRLYKYERAFATLVMNQAGDNQDLRDRLGLIHRNLAKFAAKEQLELVERCFKNAEYECQKQGLSFHCPPKLKEKIDGLEPLKDRTRHSFQEACKNLIAFCWEELAQAQVCKDDDRITCLSSLKEDLEKKMKLRARRTVLQNEYDRFQEQFLQYGEIYGRQSAVVNHLSQDNNWYDPKKHYHSRINTEDVLTPYNVMTMELRKKSLSKFLTEKQVKEAICDNKKYNQTKKQKKKTEELVIGAKTLVAHLSQYEKEWQRDDDKTQKVHAAKVLLKMFRRTSNPALEIKLLDNICESLRDIADKEFIKKTNLRKVDGMAGNSSLIHEEMQNILKMDMDEQTTDNYRSALVIMKNISKRSRRKLEYTLKVAQKLDMIEEEKEYSKRRERYNPSSSVWLHKTINKNVEVGYQEVNGRINNILRRDLWPNRRFLTDCLLELKFYRYVIDMTRKNEIEDQRFTNRAIYGTINSALDELEDKLSQSCLEDKGMYTCVRFVTTPGNKANLQEALHRIQAVDELGRKAQEKMAFLSTANKYLKMYKFPAIDDILNETYVPERSPAQAKAEHLGVEFPEDEPSDPEAKLKECRKLLEDRKKSYKKKYPKEWIEIEQAIQFMEQLQWRKFIHDQNQDVFEEIYDIFKEHLAVKPRRSVGHVFRKLSGLGKQHNRVRSVTWS